MNKIENGIIEPSSVISSYANTVKNLSNITSNEKKKEEEFKCYANC
jgi:hypothetical protein